ncbi:MAG: hypothetical protein KA369_03675 [Spirochaetes bacterium]|nr:hypothetical protein [Spirochaetota bacterium]
MSDDYALRTDTVWDRNSDILARVRPLINNEDAVNDAALPDKLQRIVGEASNEWNNEFVITTLLDQIKEIANYQIRPYRLGNVFKDLNSPDYSPLVRDGLNVIGGESSSAKTSIVTALVLEILQNNDDTVVLFYSLDDSLFVSAKRILSQMTGMNQFNTTFDIESLNTEHNKILGRIVIKEKLDLATLQIEAEKVKEQCGCKKIIICIDYLQVVPTPVDALKREALNAAVSNLKDIQKALAADGCIIFLISQLNRDTNSTTFRYRETSEIENVADVAFDISGKMKVIKDPDTGKPQVIPAMEDPTRRIKASKNKLGPKGRRWETKINAAFNFTPLSMIQETDSSAAIDESDYDDTIGKRLR